MDSEEQDDRDALDAQAQSEERHRREDEALARTARTTDRFKRINTEWDAYWDEAMRRLP